MATLCLICRHYFKDPRVFPCLHSFCRECINGLLDESTAEEQTSIFCPTCNYKLNITKNDVKKLPCNFGVTNLLPILKLHSTTSEGKSKKLECENCQGKKVAVSRCNDCCVFMCHFCVEAHQRIQSLQSHAVVSLDAIKRAEPCCLAKQLFCNTHEGELLKLFCEDCDVPICRDCTILEHKEHRYQQINDVIQDGKRHIAVAINEAAYKIPTLENTLKDVKNMEIRVKKKAIMAEKDVDTFIDTQMRILQEIRTELKAGIGMVTRAKIHALKSQEEHLSHDLSNIKTAVQFARQSVTNGSDCETLSVKKQVITRLHQLSQKRFDAFPCQDDGLSFRVNNKKTIRDMVPQLAWIDSTTAMASLSTLQVIGGEPNIIYTTFCCQACEFVIILRDHFGQRLNRGDGRVHAAITSCPLAQQEIWGSNMKFLEIIDNEDGSYNMTYVPQYPGKYTISVAVDRCHIKGSPFCWYVSQKMKSISDHKMDIFSNDQGLFQGSSTTIDDIVIDGWYCFSWRVKFRSRLHSPSSTSTFRGRSISSVRSLPLSLASQYSFFHGCKIGVRKIPSSHSSSEASFVSASTTLPSPEGSMSYDTLKEMNKNAWFWCDGFCYTPSDPSGYPSNITLFEDGDIFVLFLNPVKKTLIIYNRESEQRDCFEGIEFPVRPYLKG